MEKHAPRISATYLLELLRNRSWGGYSLISLYLSLFSGVVVGLQYDLTTPYYSVSAMDLLVPFGEFFRSIHFYSSQGFFLFGCVHLVIAYNESEGYSWSQWTMLILSLVVGLILLFTGYVLRGDATGYSAGMIAEAILNNVPFIGGLLNDLLFAVSDHGMKRVYVHHVITFDLLLLILLWQHLVKYKVSVLHHIPLMSLTFIFCLLVAAPLEPEKLGVTYISGPWFFLGLQELLRYLHPFIAGVIVPVLFVVALIYTRRQNRWFSTLLLIVWSWLAIYTLLTIVAWFR